nr:hypothetical protein [Klebsiella pneumoniae]
MNKTKGCLIANFATVPVHQPDALHPEDVSIYAHSRLSFCHPILLHRFCCIDTVTGFVTAGERFIV